MYDSRGNRFVRHGPCEACGSRDNVGWYSDGSGFCFGCGRLYKASGGGVGSGQVGRLRLEKDGLRSEVAGEVGLRCPPDDIGTHFTGKVIEWVKKYDLTVEDLIRNNIKWSPSREQLIYLFYGRDEEVILWQARNFRDGTTHKSRFFTGGTPEEVIAAYPPKQTEGTVGVFVEDCISALKVGKSGFVGLPCFSSSVSTRKLARISKRFDHLIWWLDGDKYKEAVKQADRSKLLGVKTSVIFTQLDPKEYSISAIQKYILNKIDES